MCIHYDGGRVAASESLIAEISARGLRKTIRANHKGMKVKAATLAKMVIGLRDQQD